jgi:solute carrier family 39 (zinc transporter), member 12
LIAIFLLPFFKKRFYNKILETLHALSASTLFSDALLHLIPEVLGLGEENESDYIHVPDYIIKICVSIFCLYLFWLIDIVTRQLTSNKQNGGGGHGHSHGSYHDSTISSSSNNENDLLKLEKNKDKGCIKSLKYVDSLGWIIILGDAIHNLTDGLAVGASFSESLIMGLSTSIAVVFHEIPRNYEQNLIKFKIYLLNIKFSIKDELGNYAELVKCGFSHYQALFFNFLSATTCIIGFYIGVTISTDPAVSKWILTITIGLFLYMSLVELVNIYNTYYLFFR